jgi:HD-GYP domain-containing protein (c-di-GMP phosphodiesterase class II)
MILTRGVQDPRDESTLLELGQRLTPARLARLHEAGVYDLWVEWPGLSAFDGLSAAYSDTEQRVGEALRDGFVSHALAVGVMDAAGLGALAADLARPVFQNAVRSTALEQCDGRADTLLRHGAEVAALALSLLTRLESYVAQERRWTSSPVAAERAELGLGCLLHDLGELQVPAERREWRREVLASDEPDASWRTHAALGYDLVRGQIGPVAASIVLNHHQHFDGSGFGAGASALAGRRLHIFWRLATVADTLLHLRQRDGVPAPMVYGLAQIQRPPVAGWFDPVVCDTLLQVVLPFVPGMLVELSDGSSALVEHCEAAMPCCPVVRLLGTGVPADQPKPETLVDLRCDGTRWVTRVDGMDVSDLLYGPMPERHSGSVELPKELALVG